MSKVQTITGKAFEYACLFALENSLISQEIQIVDSKSYQQVKEAFGELGASEKAKYLKAAFAAAEILLSLEPLLENADEASPLILSVNPDEAGMAGDVRDVLCMRTQKKWEIGISCKHNHDAVKHSRLSKTIDFGKQWMNVECSKVYWDEITPIFERLEYERILGRNWSQLENKQTEIYVPILEAFKREMERICRLNSETPQRLLQYLLGTYDFYKIISRENQKATELKAFNLNDSLGKASNSVRPVTRIRKLPLPTRLIEIVFKIDADGTPNNTTLHVTFDAGWQIAFRIHSASTKVEPSLKFDIKLIGNPSVMYTEMRGWGDTVTKNSVY